MILAALVSTLLLAAPAQPKTAPPAAKAPAAPAAIPPKSAVDTDFPLGPMPPGVKVAWAHAPYEDGDCSLCHERKDAKNPGRIIMPVNELCVSCHDEFTGVLARAHVHRPVKKNCVNCHNPHNSPEKKLLHAEVPKLCNACHDEMLKDFASAKVKHLAVERDKKCLNCHNPHGAAYERLLVKAPYDLCLSCHNTDELKDPAGKKLTNMEQLLKENPRHHKPVAEKDCSACHSPHSSPNMRLLSDPYPPEFYSAFEPARYKLCFECHKPEVVTTKETTTLTRFRDGSRNLHFVHVNGIEGRGRTCRACHEVHASKQPHQIRDSVPFGPRGWLLKTNYQQLPNGGQCDKTCHAAKTYVNRAPGEKLIEVIPVSADGKADPKADPKDPKAAADPKGKKLPEKKK